MSAALLSLAASITFVVVACASSSPSLVIPLAANGFGNFQLNVYDATGLVTAGRPTNEPGTHVIHAEALALPDSSEIVVRWLGGACSHAPTLNVSGDASRLRLVLDAPPDPSIPFLPILCPAVGIPFNATLTMRESVGQEALVVEQLRP